jgi:ketosteroid isomerase-like protein
MKIINLLSVSTILIIIASCTQPPCTKVDRAAELNAIEDLLESYIVANENQDFNLIEQIWAPDSDIILYGTNTDERLMGWTNIRNAIRIQFSAIENTYISASDQYIRINECGNTGWFAETLNYNFVIDGEAQSYEGLRFTGVVVKMDDNWRFVQAHLSLPANVNIGE